MHLKCHLPGTTGLGEIVPANLMPQGDGRWWSRKLTEDKGEVGGSSHVEDSLQIDGDVMTDAHYAACCMTTS